MEGRGRRGGGRGKEGGVGWEERGGRWNRVEVGERKENGVEGGKDEKWREGEGCEKC